MTSAAAMIEVNDISVSFGEVVALDGVSLQIMPGECIGLVGHNGAGKSTIVNVINGGLTPQAGVISSDGEVQSPYGINAARARGLRCVFQELSLCPNLSIIENTRIMHRTLGGWGWRDRARAIISESLDDIFPDHGIDPSSQIGALSIAERQMVEVAMAFSDPGIAPRLVILDEPTSSLDAGLAAQLLAKVRRFVKAGGAVVLISHILQEILFDLDPDCGDEGRKDRGGAACGGVHPERAGRSDGKRHARTSGADTGEGRRCGSDDAAGQGVGHRFHRSQGRGDRACGPWRSRADTDAAGAVRDEKPATGCQNATRR